MKQESTHVRVYSMRVGSEGLPVRVNFTGVWGEGLEIERYAQEDFTDAGGDLFCYFLCDDSQLGCLCTTRSMAQVE